MTETAKSSKNIFGDKLYQRRARQALPILVRQAKYGVPIYYSDLAAELSMRNPRNLNYVLGSVGQTLVELGTELNSAVPPLQCLVINKATEMPGEGVGWFFDALNVSGIGVTEFASLSQGEKRQIVDAELAQVYGFQRWDEILSRLGLEGIGASDNLQPVSGFGGSGESEAHKRLKQFVARNPALVGAASHEEGDLEKDLYSGDRLDVSFEHNNEWIGVEVKSALSNDSDIRRGLYQCVKYSAVMKAMLAAECSSARVSTVLVMEGSLPPTLVPLKNLLGVIVRESVSPNLVQ